MLDNPIAEEMASQDECRQVFRSSDFFSTVSDSDIAALSQHMTARNYVAGATLFYEDDASDAVYFLMRGAIEIFKSDQTGKKLPLIILRDSGLIGEMGLLNATARTATARALAPTRVLVLSSDNFYRELAAGSVPAHRLILAFARIVSQRLASMDQRLFELFENQTEGAQFHETNKWRQRLMALWTGLSTESVA